jgi:hypothetical protein
MIRDSRVHRFESVNIDGTEVSILMELLVRDGKWCLISGFCRRKGGKVSSLQVSMNDALDDGLLGTSIWKLRNINTEYDVLQSGVPLLSCTTIFIQVPQSFYLPRRKPGSILVSIYYRRLVGK